VARELPFHTALQQIWAEGAGGAARRIAMFEPEVPPAPSAASCLLTKLHFSIFLPTPLDRTDNSCYTQQVMQKWIEIKGALDFCYNSVTSKVEVLQ
jgi:hypothetical protein